MQVSRQMARAERSLKKNNPTEAVDVCNEILLRFPGNKRAQKIKEAAVSMASEDLQYALDLAFQDLVEHRFVQAQRQAAQILQRHPACVSAMLVAAISQAETGDLAQGITQLQTALSLDPQNVPVHVNLASMLFNSERFSEAEAVARSLLEIDSFNASALEVLGHSLHKLGKSAEAAQFFKQTLDTAQAEPTTLLTIGSALGLAGDTSNALKAFLRLLDLVPDSFDGHMGVAEQLLRSGELGAAMNFYQQSAQIDPASADAQCGLAHCWFKQRHFDQAAAHYLRAIEAKPDHGAALIGLANCRALVGARDDAARLLEHAVVLDPSNDEALANLLHARARNCDWRPLPVDDAHLRELGIDGTSVNPFYLLTLDDAPDRLRQRVETYASATFPNVLERDFKPPAERPARLKIGFYSSDFHEHATLHLMVRLFELLDLDRFEPILFSYGGRGQGPARLRLEATKLPVHEVGHLSDSEIARISRDQGIDIGIDLKGHTTGSRLGPFAYGLAPIQMHYLGYPGSLGCSFIDYFVADSQVLPDGWQSSMSEKVIVLPDCYQVNDDQREIAETPPSRTDLGLPEDAFVFASFNDPFKITPQLFSTWMTLLHDQPTSVLWIYAPRADIQANLLAQAEQQGIGPERLVFAAHLEQAEHLARLQCADLFLDSFICCAHTTACDALWAGLPILTCEGTAFQGRVAASLLRTAGLPELVTGSQAAYAERALHLTRHPKELQQIKAKLATARAESPLFDTARFARGFEHGLDMAYDRFLKGQPADHLFVPSQETTHST